MLTIVIPNRNRSLTTVQRTLSSLASQCIDGVTAVVVDYGSAPSYQEDLQRLVDSYKNITTVGLQVKEYGWVENFIQKYTSYLPKDNRENALTYNLAKVYFSQKKYNQVIEQLREVESVLEETKKNV